MDAWAFLDFRNARGVNTIRAWLDSLPVKASAKINARLLFMRAMPIWPEQYVSALRGWPDIVELRVVSAGNQYRPLGFYGPGRREFTLVLGAIEKGKIPPRVLEVANENRSVALNDNGRICGHVYDAPASGEQPSSE